MSILLCGHGPCLLYLSQFTQLHVNVICRPILKYVYQSTCVSNYALMLGVWIPLRRGVLDTALCDKVCQWLAAGQWFSPGSLVSFTNKTDHHDITEILLKVEFNTITLTQIMHVYLD
jgi:hypothetical protein